MTDKKANPSIVPCQCSKIQQGFQSPEEIRGVSPTSHRLPRSVAKRHHGLFRSLTHEQTPKVSAQHEIDDFDVRLLVIRRRFVLNGPPPCWQICQRLPHVRETDEFVFRNGLTLPHTAYIDALQNFSQRQNRGGFPSR